MSEANGNLHSDFENMLVPKITHMKLDEYIMNIDIQRDICIVKCKAGFIPTTDGPDKSSDNVRITNFVIY